MMQNLMRFSLIAALFLWSVPSQAAIVEGESQIFRGKTDRALALHHAKPKKGAAFSRGRKPGIKRPVSSAVG